MAKNPSQVTSTIVDDFEGNIARSKISKEKIFLDALYKTLNFTTDDEQWFEAMDGPLVEDFFNDQELKMIDEIINHPKQTKWSYKLQKLDAIIKPKGFKRKGQGTNRVCYEPYFSNKFILKVAMDYTGSTNAPNELLNQKYLKPYVSKCFDVSIDGNVGIFEKVYPIMSLDQFWSIREDIFRIMEKLVGRFIIDDFGTTSFMNWGVRAGFGPVLLDYADMYILDPKTLYCKNPIDFGRGGLCGGEMEYSPGFNELRCKKCGGATKAFYFKGRPKIAVYYSRRGLDMNFQITIKKGGKVVKDGRNFDKTVREEAVAPIVDQSEDYKEISATIKRVNKELEESAKIEQHFRDIQSGKIDPKDSPYNPNKDKPVEEEHPKKRIIRLRTFELPDLSKPEPKKKVRRRKDKSNRKFDKEKYLAKHAKSDEVDSKTEVEIKEELNSSNNKEENMKTPIDSKLVLNKDEIVAVGKAMVKTIKDIEALEGTEEAFTYEEFKEHYNILLVGYKLMHGRPQEVLLTELVPYSMISIVEFEDGKSCNDELYVNTQHVKNFIKEEYDAVFKYLCDKINDFDIESDKEDEGEEDDK